MSFGELPAASHQVCVFLWRFFCHCCWFFFSNLVHLYIFVKYETFSATFTPPLWSMGLPGWPKPPPVPSKKKNYKAKQLIVFTTFALHIWRRSTALTWSRWGCRRLADIWLLAHDNNNNNCTLNCSQSFNGAETSWMSYDATNPSIWHREHWMMQLLTDLPPLQHGELDF